MTQGILLLDKPKGKTSFYLVHLLRKLTSIRKIGHAGTLDPLATGVMVMLVGSQATKTANTHILHDKEYEALILLGSTSDSYDLDGQIVSTSPIIPTLSEIEEGLNYFQGAIEQIPPMFSAKKHKGKKLYELARQGRVVERKPSSVVVKTKLLSYSYPYLTLHIECSSGTYIRTIAHDLGQMLGCGALIAELQRTRSGPYRIENCIPTSALEEEGFNIQEHLRSL
jgi:tRNA pseudouridine55 synthase